MEQQHLDADHSGFILQAHDLLTLAEMEVSPLMLHTVRALHAKMGETIEALEGLC